MDTPPLNVRPLTGEGEAHAPEAVRLSSFGAGNGSAELVADLIEATRLVGQDRLALARGRIAERGSFAEALVAEGLASSAGVARVLAARHQLPVVNLSETRASPEAFGLVPLHVLLRVAALPYRLEGDVLHVAIADPQNVQTLDELRLATRHQLAFAVASRDEIAAELDRLGRGPVGPVIEPTPLPAPGLETDDPNQLVADLDEEDGVSEGPIVRIVNSIILQAAEDGASDLHFEAQEDGLVVRLRIDGVLHEVQRIPKRMMAGVTTRLKVLAKLDIAERRKPQDGRISLNAAAAGRLLDIRVATLPTVEGESLVMRLLDKSKKAPTLEELGLSDEMRDQLLAIVNRPTGALLVTGPTGSGKSTTLYASLAEINKPEINIIT